MELFISHQDEKEEIRKLRQKVAELQVQADRYEVARIRYALPSVRSACDSEMFDEAMDKLREDYSCAPFNLKIA